MKRIRIVLSIVFLCGISCQSDAGTNAQPQAGRYIFVGMPCSVAESNIYASGGKMCTMGWPTGTVYALRSGGLMAVVDDGKKTNAVVTRIFVRPKPPMVVTKWLECYTYDLDLESPSRIGLLGRILKKEIPLSQVDKLPPSSEITNVVFSAEAQLSSGDRLTEAGFRKLLDEGKPINPSVEKLFELDGFDFGVVAFDTKAGRFYTELYRSYCLLHYPDGRVVAFGYDSLHAGKR